MKVGVYDWNERRWWVSMILPFFKGIPTGCPLPCQECKYTGVRRWNPRIPILFPLNREFWWKITGKVVFGHEKPEGIGWMLDRLL